MKRTHLAAAFGSALLLVTALAQALAQETRQGPERWESAVQKFEEADRQSKPADGAFVFVGASSIVR